MLRITAIPQQRMYAMIAQDGSFCILARTQQGIGLGDRSCRAFGFVQSLRTVISIGDEDLRAEKIVTPSNRWL